MVIGTAARRELDAYQAIGAGRGEYLVNRVEQILLQNLALHAGITSPVGSLIGTMLREVSQGNEAAVMIDDAQRQALLRGVFDAYYHAIHPSRTVFDTNRAWPTGCP